MERVPDHSGDPGELESVDAVGRLLQHFDRSTGTWALKTHGSFWEAIKIAHSAGRRGAGTSIAILDGWCDTSIPQLSKRLRSIQLAKGASAVATGHGTAVALLIATVAPEATLDFYGICDARKRPTPACLTDAVSRAAETDITLINLSASLRRSVPDSVTGHAGKPALFGTPDVPMDRTEIQDCGWCAVGDRAWKSGKLIVAAAGNDAWSISCPARSPKTISAGFQIERRVLVETGAEQREEGVLEAPEGYMQNPHVAFWIQQPSDALGSSFATPLLTGALALGIPVGELPRWFLARWHASQALNALVPGHHPETMKKLLIDAWTACPHDHSGEADPPPCFECSLFLEGLYATETQFWAVHNAFHAAPRLLMAQAVMPWSPHAFVNYAIMQERRAQRAVDPDAARDLRAEAIEFFEYAATRCTPPSSIAAAHLQRLRARQGLQS